MVPRSPRAPKRPNRTAPWVWIAITLFVVGDLLLVWAAVSAARTPPEPNSRVAGSVQVEIEPSATATPEPTAPADLTVARPAVVLAAFDVDTAYRAPMGECPVTPAALEVSTDGGVTWGPATVTDASAIESIATEGSTTLSVVAREADGCAPGVFRSFVQGAGWAEADEIGDRWRLDGANVVAPGGAAYVPCAAPVQVVAASATEAAVLCGDAVVHTTGDGGVTWTASEPISGAAAISARPGGYLVAVERQGECTGVQVASLEATGALGAPGACVVTEPAEGLTSIAMSSDGAALWIWANGIVNRSFDGGATW